MATDIDWAYLRDHCETCAKAHRVLAKKRIKIKQRVNARANKLNRREALKLAKSAASIVAVRGRKVVAYDMKKDAPSDTELLAAILGPTGNLRAPAIRVGSTLVVGFDEESYRNVLG